MKSLLIFLTSVLTVKAEAFVGSGEHSAPRRPEGLWRRWMSSRPIVSTQTLRRGDSYGTWNNSTILSAQDAAAAVGVAPPANVSAAVWKRAYTIQKYATPILHLFDKQKPPNSSLNLYCIWWKAISGNDRTSPVYDNYLSFDLLPRYTRWIVRRPKMFPRLHHANVEIRTAYLDRAVALCAEEARYRQTNVSQVRPSKTTADIATIATSRKRTKIRLICMGAGYDVRSIKLKERGVVDVAYELDLPDVVEAKRILLESKRFQKRRPQTVQESLPTTYAVDLNNLDEVKTALLEILQSPGDDTDENVHTIFLFEAVMIYLNEGVPRALLQVCSEVLHMTEQKSGSLCFADRLENVPGGEYDSAWREMHGTGWNLVEWLPKPGLARHMGRAQLILNRYT